MPESTHDEALLGSIPESRLSREQVQSLGRSFRVMRHGQGSPYNDPIWGEQHRGSLDSIVANERPLHDLVGGVFSALGTTASNAQEAVEAAVSNAYSSAVDWINDTGSRAVQASGMELNLYPIEKFENYQPPTNPYGTDAGGMGFASHPSLIAPIVTSRELKDVESIFRDADWELQGAAEGVRDFTVAFTTGIPKVRSATGETEGFTQAVKGATPAVTKLGDEFGASAHGPIPEYASGLGLVADQMLEIGKASESWPEVQRFAKALTHSPAAGGGPAAPAGGSGNRSGGTQTDPLAHDPRYNPGEGESWEHYFQVALNLAKNGRTDRERKLGRERAVRAAQILGIPVPTFAGGTPFAPGGLALVGEMGPELVNLPRGSQVIPNPRLGGDVHVHVNVEGSVVAERDLAQRLRQELIRTSRRTVDLGFN